MNKNIYSSGHITDSSILNSPQIIPHAQGGGGSGAVYVSSGTAVNPIPQWVKENYHTSAITDEQMIFMRLNNRNYITSERGIDFLATHRITAETVAVFVCNNGAYVVLEDDANLFPSDSLITQLRMLSK